MPPIRSSTAAFDGNRWRASTPIHGIFMGDAITKCRTSGYQGYADDIEFHGNVVPEPSSLLALGSGILALAGMTDGLMVLWSVPSGMVIRPFDHFSAECGIPSLSPG